MSLREATARHVAALIPQSRIGKRWILVNLTNSIGDGLFISGNAVFATKIIGLSGDQVGIGISLAGIAGIVGAGAMGSLADRFGARRMLGILCVLQSMGYVLYGLTASSFVPFVLIMCMISICKNGAYPASAALVAEIGSPEGRVELRAQARSAYNVGFSLGAALAAAALAIDTKPAYYALPIGSALAYLVVRVVIRRLPEVTSPVHRQKKALGALRDVPFLVTTSLTTVLSIHASLLMVVIPLWIVERTTVPPPMIGILLVLNTMFVIAFQVAASKGAETLEGSARKARWAGVAMAVGCVGLAPSGAISTYLAILLVAAAFLLLSFGEILQSASAWGMSYALAPKAAQAEYLGAFSMSQAGQAVLAPAIGTVLVLRSGMVGWLILGGLIMASALALGPAARWAQASITRRFPVVETDPVR